MYIYRIIYLQILFLWLIKLYNFDSIKIVKLQFILK